MIENGRMDENALDWSLARWVQKISDSHDPVALQDYVFMCVMCKTSRRMVVSPLSSGLLVNECYQLFPLLLIGHNTVQQVACLYHYVFHLTALYYTHHSATLDQVPLILVLKRG